MTFVCVCVCVDSQKVLTCLSYVLLGLQDRRFSDEIDKLTGYKTKSLLCMPIRNSDGEIIGVAQAINKTSSVELFTEDDEKVMELWVVLRAKKK